MDELLEAQKRFVNSCQQVQQDDPKNLSNIVEKLIESLIKITKSTFREFDKIREDITVHDSKVMKFLNATRIPQTDVTCRRLESAFRNTSHTILKENELRQLTEKFVALTDRADAALQRLELQLKEDPEETAMPASDVTVAADILLQKLEGINNEESNEDPDWEDDEAGYYDDGGGGSDIMDEDKAILNGGSRAKLTSNIAVHPHRRHLHKHPYDRGPTLKKASYT